MRVLISVPKEQDLYLRRRGIVGVSDPLTSGLVKRAPGDQADASSAASGFWVRGDKFATYGDEAYDFKYVKGESTYYGKLVIGSITYDPLNSTTTTSQIPVTVIFQTKAGSPHYLW